MVLIFTSETGDMQPKLTWLWANTKKLPTVQAFKSQMLSSQNQQLTRSTRSSQARQIRWQTGQNPKVGQNFRALQWTRSTQNNVSHTHRLGVQLLPGPQLEWQAFLVSQSAQWLTLQEQVGGRLPQSPWKVTPISLSNLWHTRTQTFTGAWNTST
jgi:hypothetical protein